MKTPEIANISELFERYDSLFFDSFGVLVDGVEALPGAIELVEDMNRENTNYFIVTNDASVSIRSRATKFASQGLNIPTNRIVNSGSLITDYIAAKSLKGAPALVLGTDAVRDYTTAGGAILVDIKSEQEPDLVVVGHSNPYDWESTLDYLLNLLGRRFRSGNPIKLILPNPDFIYPNGLNKFSFGAASFVNLLEQALLRLHGSHDELTAIKLGKPSEPIFKSALLRAKTSNAVMIGDQLETDILGANRMGLDSAVVTTGINRKSTAEDFKEVTKDQTPRYILRSLI